VQEVFLRTYRHLDQFHAQSSFYTWIYRITVNVFFDHRKKLKRAVARIERLESELSDATCAVRAGDDPYEAVDLALRRERFDRAVEALPDVFRSIFTLREIDDLSYQEIATLAGISVGTVRSRLSRARGRLKELLRPGTDAEAA